MSSTSVIINVGARTAEAVRELNNVNKALGEQQSTAQKAGAGVRKAYLPAVGAFTAVSAAAFKVVKGAEAAATANARLSQVFESMGYSENAQAALDYADSMEQVWAVEAEVIKAAQAKLATFSEVAKSSETMGRATQIAADLSAAGFGSMDSAAVMLGKAIQDPIKGMNAMARVGVTFTDEQRNMITAMVEAGDTAGAQGLIMEALETQVGGVAEATADSSVKMGLAFGAVADAIGAALLPAFNAITPVIVMLTEKIAGHGTAVAVAMGAVAALSAAIIVANGVMRVWGAVLVAARAAQAVWTVATTAARAATLLFALATQATTVAQITQTAATNGGKAAMVAARIATTVWTAAQWLLNAALTANPIGLVVAAIALLVGALVLAYNKSDTFRSIVNAVGTAIRTYLLVNVNAVRAAFGALTSAISAALDWLGRLWDKITSAPSLPSWIPGLGRSSLTIGYNTDTAPQSLMRSPTGWAGRLSTSSSNPVALVVNFNTPMDAEGAAREIGRLLRRSALRNGTSSPAVIL